MVFVCLLFCAFLVPSQAQVATESQPRTWDISVWGAAATGEENTNSFAEAQIVSAGVFLGRRLTDEIGSGWRAGRLEVGFDVAPVFLQFSPRRVHGLGFDPIILRWSSSLHRGRAVPFIELGGGGVHSNVNFPSGDTSTFNFMARGGGGILISTRRAHALELGCRWWHISNANLGNQNPEFNSIQVSVGWHWYK
jgi:Lipid A 3-O-deacylase (PagL)